MGANKRSVSHVIKRNKIKTKTNPDTPFSIYLFSFFTLLAVCEFVGLKRTLSIEHDQESFSFSIAFLGFFVFSSIITTRQSRGVSSDSRSERSWENKLHGCLLTFELFVNLEQLPSQHSPSLWTRSLNNDD